MFEVSKIEEGSIAEEMEIIAGDFLVSINGKEIVDIFDYRYLIAEEEIEVVIQKKNGEQWVLEIDKEIDEDLGFIFKEGLMSEAKSCKNKCIFCFIDQLPDGMRETLYFKDDDSRLSFLQGNYVTLTNMSDEDIDRIIFYHLSPINISVHSTDLELRKFMLKNPQSDKILLQLQKFKMAGIEMNFQIVLCKGINDGKYLEQSINDLSKFMPIAKSLSIVPVGISKFRETNNLSKLQPFSETDSMAVIETVNRLQVELKEKYDNNFVFCSDEFYLTAQLELPKYEYYEDFPQIENGVGMITLMEQEFSDYLSTLEESSLNKKVSIATGKAAENFIISLAKRLEMKFSGLKISVFAIKNNFFGENITVSGLLTGSDIIAQLDKKELGEVLYLPSNILKSGENILLDNISISEIESRLSVEIVTIESNGKDFIKKII